MALPRIHPIISRDRVPPSLLFYPSLTSTNDKAAELMRQGVLAIGVVADSQTAGRGKQARPWQSASGGLFLSYTFVATRPQAWHLLSLGAAFAAQQGIKEYLSLTTLFKWPNDLMWNDRKIAGILVEATTQGETTAAAIGIGINVNQRQFGGELDQRAVSLREASGSEVDIARLGLEIMRQLERLCQSRFDLTGLPDRVQTAMYGQERVAYLTANGEEEQVEVVGIAADGALIVSRNGRIDRVYDGTLRYAIIK